MNAQSRLAQRTEVKKPALTFADVGGLEDAKKQIRELVRANLDGGKLRQYGVHRNGILLHGPRGTGKTFLAEAVAGEFGLNYFHVSAASLVDKYIGQTEENLEAVFRKAQSNRPPLLFIDEIDALGTTKQRLGESDDPGGASRSFNLKADRLISCIDGARKDLGLIVVAATNFYDGLDRALIREGRFDLHIRLDLPSLEERARIFKHGWLNVQHSESICSLLPGGHRDGVPQKSLVWLIAPPFLRPRKIEESKQKI